MKNFTRVMILPVWLRALPGHKWEEIILFVESSLSRGKGVLTLSGQLGDVMKESAVAHYLILKSNATSLGIDHRVFQQYDLHVHVPAGAVPKDRSFSGDHHVDFISFNFYATQGQS